jgi:hypothetical protein
MQTIDNNFTTNEDDKNLTSQYLKKHEDLVIHLTPRIKNSNVLNVFSFFGTEYDQFFSKYNWNTLENMLRYLLVDDRIRELVLVNTLDELLLADETANETTTENVNNNEYHNICPIDLTGHLFKKFEKFKSVIPIFYPNIVTDLKDIDDYDSCFNMYYWFYWIKGCHAYPSYYEDDGTNYNDIVNMFVRILRHFDDWYWNHYDGDNVVETSLVEDIVDIYKTIEKFYYADKNKTATEIDETLEEQSWRVYG